MKIWTWWQVHVNSQSLKPGSVHGSSPKKPIKVISWSLLCRAHSMKLLLDFHEFGSHKVWPWLFVELIMGLFQICLYFMCYQPLRNSWDFFTFGLLLISHAWSWRDLPYQGFWKHPELPGLGHIEPYQLRIGTVWPWKTVWNSELPKNACIGSIRYNTIPY